MKAAAHMLTTVEGVYRDGQVELPELPSGVESGTRVLVTFLSPNTIDLARRGIDEAAAEDLRSRLATFADEWDSPEMADYDDYEASRRKLEAR